jgi:iron complex transport system ATP-binding protein
MLARATLAQPSLLILDEPMSNLDMGGRELFLKLVSRLAQGPNAPTIILTTHNINEIGPFITNTIILKKGRVLSEGPISESLTAANLQQAFDLPLKLEKTKQGRYMAWLD